MASEASLPGPTGNGCDGSGAPDVASVGISVAGVSFGWPWVGEEVGLSGCSWPKPGAAWGSVMAGPAEAGGRESLRDYGIEGWPIAEAACRDPPQPSRTALLPSHLNARVTCGTSTDISTVTEVARMCNASSWQHVLGKSYGFML